MCQNWVRVPPLTGQLPETAGGPLPPVVFSSSALYRESLTSALCNREMLNGVPSTIAEKVVAVESLSRFRLFVTPRTAAHQASLSFTISWSLLKLMSIELIMPSNLLILCCPLLLPSIFLSIRVYSNKLALPIRWLKYWSFSFSISPSNDYSGLISFTTDWFNLLGRVKGLSRVLSKSINFFWHSAFFMVLLSHPYVTTGKAIALTIQSFANKVMSLPCDMLPRFVLQGEFG